MFTTHTRVPQLHAMSTIQQNNLRQAIDKEASLPSTLRWERHNAGFIGVPLSLTLYIYPTRSCISIMHENKFCITVVSLSFSFYISPTLSFSNRMHKNKFCILTCLMPMSALCPGRHAFGSSHHKLWKQRRATLTGRTLRTKARGGCGTPRVHGGGERDAAPGPRTRGC